MSEDAIREQVWPARPESVTEARRAATLWASEIGADEERQCDIALAVSEACTNAVIHAYDEREPGRFRVCVERADGTVRVVVTDWGRGMRPRFDSPGLGLGLPVITRVASSLEVRVREGEPGTTLVMAFG